MSRDCRRCLHVSENIVGGMNELICAHPDIPHGELELDPATAETCDFYEQDKHPGLYFHEVPNS